MRVLTLLAAASLGVAQTNFTGAVPAGPVSAEPLTLSLADAIRLGLERNLGGLVATQNQRTARGEKIVALSRLLPNLKTTINETSQQVNLNIYGFPLFPGVPPVVGPFGIFDTRAVVSQQVFNLRSLYNNRASGQQEKAAGFTVQDARDTIVMVVASLYFQAVAGASRIDAAQAQVTAADALYQQAVDQKNAGLLPAIDVLRAQVQLQAERQSLIASQNDFEKQKLSLEEAIGAPSAQSVRP